MGFNEEEILEAVDAKLLKSTSAGSEYEISTDTRTIKQGDIYLPLKGVNFDGENFLDEAIEKGAAGCFITKDYYPLNAKLVFKVDDTLETYLSLARFRRNKLNPKVIAITGSSGKTTTKEMVYSVVSEKFKTYKTYSNNNNEVGLCRTILSMPDDTEVLIVEMGMRGLGEIEILSKYAEPDFSIITNAGSAHIGRLRSLENIAKAKAEIVKYQNKSGTLISHNNQMIKDFIDFEGEKIYYSIADAKILDKKQGYSKFLYKDKEYELNVDGDYNIENSISAIEVAYKLTMTYEEIKKGLLAYKPIEKRWEIENVNGYTIINDSYNANPESMKASVSSFIELYKNPVVILGDMGELGENETEFHSQVGRFLAEKAKNLNNVKFLTVGNLAEKIAKELSNSGVWVESFDNNANAARYIVDNLDVNNTIFLKASRSMKFEEIISYIRDNKEK